MKKLIIVSSMSSAFDVDVEDYQVIIDRMMKGEPFDEFVTTSTLLEHYIMSPEDNGGLSTITVIDENGKVEFANGELPESNLEIDPSEFDNEEEEVEDEDGEE